MKIQDILTEWNDWDEGDDLSGHHAAGFSEAQREDIVDDIYRYLNDPIMIDHIKGKYPRISSMKNMQVVADTIAFTQVNGKNVIDWLDYHDEYAMDDAFEDMIEDALESMEKMLGMD